MSFFCAFCSYYSLEVRKREKQRNGRQKEFMFVCACVHMHVRAYKHLSIRNSSWHGEGVFLGMYKASYLEWGECKNKWATVLLSRTSPSKMRQNTSWVESQVLHSGRSWLRPSSHQPALWAEAVFFFLVWTPKNYSFSEPEQVIWFTRNSILLRFCLFHLQEADQPQNNGTKTARGFRERQGLVDPGLQTLHQPGVGPGLHLFLPIRHSWDGSRDPLGRQKTGAQ